MKKPIAFIILLICSLLIVMFIFAYFHAYRNISETTTTEFKATFVSADIQPYGDEFKCTVKTEEYGEKIFFIVKFNERMTKFITLNSGTKIFFRIENYELKNMYETDKLPSIEAYSVRTDTADYFTLEDYTEIRNEGKKDSIVRIVIYCLIAGFGITYSILVFCGINIFKRKARK